MRHSTKAARKATDAHLKAAVHRAKPLSRAGVLERMFTFAFSKLVYPQIWEDPVVDMKALDIGPGHEVIAIASGGCNVLSYLIADPAGVTAVDLNGAHIALGKLKICARSTTCPTTTPSSASSAAPTRAPTSPSTTAPARQARSRRRAPTGTSGGRSAAGASACSRATSTATACSGIVLGAGHALARLHGLDPSIVLEARTLEEQRRLYEERLAPIFDKPLVRWMMKQPASLYGLGIPPAQYKALAGDSPRGIGAVLEPAGRAARLRLRRSRTIISPGRRSAGATRRGRTPSLPPYLQRENFDAVRSRVGPGALCPAHRSPRRCATSRPARFDRYVLLDAQDWMNDGRPHGAVDRDHAHRAAGRPGDLPHRRRRAAAARPRAPSDLLGRWRYDEEASRELGRQDRSSIYGAFHLYVLKDA